jgi:hypothetical protein
MTQPIYKAWQINRTAEAWHQLSAEEQDAYFAKLEIALTTVGGKRVVTCTCWSTDGVQYFGVEEFPSVEAVQQHTKLLNELSLFRYVESSSLLGSLLTNTTAA